MVTLLLDARAACDQAETERGRTPLHLAANQRPGEAGQAGGVIKHGRRVKDPL